MGHSFEGIGNLKGLSNNIYLELILGPEVPQGKSTSPGAGLAKQLTYHLFLLDGNFFVSLRALKRYHLTC